MPSREGEPEMLPGLRATVADSRAKAAATRRAQGGRGRAGGAPTRSRGCSSTCRWPTSTGPSTTSSRPRTPTPRCPGPGSRCASPARTSTATSSAARRESDHTGRLTPLRRVVSPEPVLSPEVVALAGAVAERYAGSRADVLRLAVPPRHATTEAKPSPGRGPAAADAASRWPGPATSRPRASSPTSPTAARPGRSGRPPPAPTGRRRSPTPLPRRTPRGGARCSSSPTAATSPGSTPP